MGSNPLFEAYAYAQLLCGVKLDKNQFYALLAALLQFYIREAEKTSYSALILCNKSEDEENNDSDSEQEDDESEPPKKKQKVEQNFTKLGHLELPADVWAHIASYLKIEDVFNLTN